MSLSLPAEVPPGAAERVRRAPNAWDRFYKDHQAPWRGERRLTPLEPWLASPVLELGAGNGKTLGPLRRAGFDAVALDLSWHALRRLDGRRVLADATWLPFADASFGAVLDLHCTGHLPPDRRAQALQEAWRVTAPGGHLLQERLGATDLRASSGQPVQGGGRTLADGRSTWFLTHEQLEQELEAAGWRVIGMRLDVREPAHKGTLVRREHVSMIARRD